VVAFATRAGLAARRDVVEVLHLTGAEDGQIANLFELRFARIAAVAGPSARWPRPWSGASCACRRRRRDHARPADRLAGPAGRPALPGLAAIVAARRRAPHGAAADTRPLMKSVAAFLVVALIWFCGLLAFASRVQHETPAAPPAPRQGIVALTGAGSNERIAEAMSLLEDGYGRRVLVSGVNPRPAARTSATSRAPCAASTTAAWTWASTAADTVGNARETAAWAQAMRYDRLIVVTADYHMPRAMLELNAVLRGTGVTAETYRGADAGAEGPHWWRIPGAARLMVLEYCKYLAILGREGVLGLGPARRPRAATAEAAS
jgi:uncharacterized SAM-binding protein YcdF (DUF218 family)